MYKHSLRKIIANDTEKMTKLEAAAEKTNKYDLEQAYKDIKAGKELKLVDRDTVMREIYKKNARLVVAFTEAFKKGDHEKVDKLFSAAEKTAKGDLINFYNRVKAGEDLSYLAKAEETVKEEDK